MSSLTITAKRTLEDGQDGALTRSWSQGAQTDRADLHSAADDSLKAWRPETDTGGMTLAAHTIEQDSMTSAIERAWTNEEFEILDEEQATAVLTRRMRRLTQRGIDPHDALILAARLNLPLA